MREKARKRFGDHVLSAQLLQAKTEIEELIQDALKAKKMGHRKSGARVAMHDSEAVLQGDDPLAEARKPLRRANSESPVALPSGLDDELPDFAVARKGE